MSTTPSPSAPENATSKAVERMAVRVIGAASVTFEDVRELCAVLMSFMAMRKALQEISAQGHEDSCHLGIGRTGYPNYCSCRKAIAEDALDFDPLTSHA
jgi:hypothetical protein